MRPDNSDAGLPPPRLGKHRIQAELKRLEQESRFLEVVITASLDLSISDPAQRNQLRGKEELEQLEKMEKASAACREMISLVKSRPDPLLPETNGPINPLWDRWFEGPQETKHCGCWIL